MTAPAPVTRYSCPLPDCGWQRDTTPADGKWAVELAMREHCDEHSTLQYVRALAEAAKREHLLQQGAIERSAMLEECRDLLVSAGHNGAHGDDWPEVAPALRALIAERDALKA